MNNKLYIRCREVEVNNGHDNTSSPSSDESNFETFITSFVTSSSSTPALVIFSVFLILFVYFLGKFIFKNTPEKFIKD